MEAVLAILSVDPTAGKAQVAWFENQLELDRWFARWSKRGGGNILPQDMEKATAAIPTAGGAVIRMLADEHVVSSAMAFTGRACHAHLELEGTKVADDGVTITFLIA